MCPKITEEGRCFGSFFTDIFSCYPGKACFCLGTSSATACRDGSAALCLTCSRGNVPDDSLHIYFLSRGLFHLSHQNRNLCLAYTKKAQSLPFLVVRIHRISPLTFLGHYKPACEKEGKCLCGGFFFFNCSLHISCTEVGKEAAAASAFWSVYSASASSV